MSAAKSHTLPDFYTWSFPGAPLQIHLSLDGGSGDSANRSRSQGKARANCPACGLLIGDTSRPGITTILDFKALPVLDIASVQAASAGAAAEIVGFYRTTPLFAAFRCRRRIELSAASTFSRPPSSCFRDRRNREIERWVMRIFGFW